LIPESGNETRVGAGKQVSADRRALRRETELVPRAIDAAGVGSELWRLVSSNDLEPEWQISGGHPDYDATGNDLTLDFTPYREGDYTLSLIAALPRTDVQFTDTTRLFVGDVAPTIVAGGDTTIAEGGDLYRELSIADPGHDATDPDAQPWSVVIDYGDGSDFEELELTSLEFTLDHVYTHPGDYDVSVIISNSEGADEDGFTVHVAEVGPTIAFSGDGGMTIVTDEERRPPVSGAEGALATVELSITDPSGSLVDQVDAWRFVVDYGDGSPAESFAVNVSDPYLATATLTHTYADDGLYTLTVTATDDDGHVAIESTMVKIANVAPTITAMSGPTGVPEGFVAAFLAAGFDPGDDTLTLDRKSVV